MNDYQPVQIRAAYRASSHLPIWQLLQACDIWEQVGIEMASFEFRNNARQAGRALLDGELDFISGNHVSTYTMYTQGDPIVHIASPSNGVRYTVASRKPISQLAEIRGLRLGETSPFNPGGSLQHIRGNHLLYLQKAGLQPEDVAWVELAKEVEDDENDTLVQAMKSNRIDVAFAMRGSSAYQQVGFHLLPLDELPMVNGPTLTTTLTNLARKDRLGERLVRAMVMGIHYAKTQPAEADQRMRTFAERSGQPVLTSARVARMPRKPYPTPESVQNAYELACIQTPSTRGQLSPLALWDLHDLRLVDHSGFIDQLYAAKE